MASTFPPRIFFFFFLLKSSRTCTFFYIIGVLEHARTDAHYETVMVMCSCCETGLLSLNLDQRRVEVMAGGEIPFAIRVMTDVNEFTSSLYEMTQIT